MQVETTLDVKPLRGEVTSRRMREELCDAARPGKGWAGLKNQQKMSLKLAGVGSWAARDETARFMGFPRFFSTMAGV